MLSISDERQAKIRVFLKAKGYNAGNIDKLVITDDKELKTEMIKLHNLTDLQYNSGGLG